MKTFNRILCLLMILFAGSNFQMLKAQTGVLDPDDPVITYSSSNPPATPPYGTLAKWVRTKRVSFNTDSYKAYYYKGFCFRLKFPKSYKDSLSNPDKKYPIFIFFHGIGERGSIYDNEYQLYHGGQKFRDYVDNGQFDGFLLYIQSSSGSGAFNDAHYAVVNELINDYFVPQIKVDINRVIVDGLSAGGGATWQMVQKYPNLVAAALPISAVAVADRDADKIQTVKYTPIWLFQGGLDTRPDPNTAHALVTAFNAAGANLTYTEYPNLGHGSWNTAWAEPDFVPFMNRAHKANPWPLFGRTEFCPGDPISATLGVTAGFDGYEWRKDGVVIPGATSNTYTATSLGVYDCRIQRGTEWSPWSPTPVEIKLKGATVSPDIQTNGLFSNVIPSPDGSTSVELVVPEGYATYEWQREGSLTVIGTSHLLTANTAGNYKVKVTEQFGCSSEFSNPFPVIDANGQNGPPPPVSLTGTALSKTEIKLDWAQNNSPAYNETGFEIYSASAANGPYHLVAVTAADAVTYTDFNLLPNTEYYYKLRAVNANAASAVTDPVMAKTQADNTAPSAPGNLTIASTTKNSVNLIWDESTDDVGVYKYDIYVNGVKFYEAEVGQATVFNLQHGTTYNFRVKARDFAGNVSPFSNQVTGQPLLNGLSYKYYTFTGTWNQLPDFTLLDPDVTGVVPNVTIANRTQNDNFAYLWEGYITIPQTGTYRFRTNSDDGSRLWLGNLNEGVSPYSFSGTPVVNNDGLHGTQNATSSSMFLQEGTYPIAIAFYEQGGGESMTVSWRTPSTGTSYVTIPNSAFEDLPIISGSAPAAPSALTAQAVSYKQVNLSWTDNSNNETEFEIWRSADPNSGFVTVGNAAANTTTYQDSGLSASTTYYYKIKSIGQYGESDLVPSYDLQANWRFNNDYNDESGNGHTLSPNNSPTFSTDRQEGSHSVDLNGSNEDMNVNTSSGDYLRGGYDAKTIAFWMRADNPGSNDGIFDFGGSDDGLAMRTNSNRLYAGVARSSTRRSISTSYSSTGWNHIALVYDQNTLRLYVNGVQSASNTNLGFTSVGTTSNGSRIGDDNSSNALNTSFGQFDGRLDDFRVYGQALSETEVQELMNGTLSAAVFATTLPLPGVPADPTNLVADGISTSKISISWEDNANNETGYELFRSAGDNTNYILYKTLPANTASYTDSALFANSIFYYKVRAVNSGGNSEESNEDAGTTLNNNPVLAAIANQFMRYNTTLDLAIDATDADPETLVVAFANLPSFAVYNSSGNGTGSLTFNPGIGDVGTYTNITVTVTDEHGGMAERTFDLVVNSNDNPVLSNVSNITLNENQAGQVNISATDANPGDVLAWSFTNMPSFATPVINGNDVQINLAPGYADNGMYQVGVRVDDGNDGFDTTSFVITINDVNPNTTIFVNFTSGTYVAPAPWNNTSKNPAINDDFANLNDESGASTAVGVQLLTAWNGSNNLGANTGNNSGIYPDAVLRSSYFTNTTRTIRIYGLNTGDIYSFTFLASRANPTVGVSTNYTIGGQTQTLDAANNSSNTVSFTNMVPDPDGSVTVSISVAAGSVYGYLNSMVIESTFTDGTPPAFPRDLAAQPFNGNVRLTWTDAAYNEDAYEVYRSLSPNSGYQLLNPGGNNEGLELYDDANVQGHTTYYYYVSAVNGYGSSYSDTISYTTPNTPPILAAIANVTMATGQVVDVNVSATDEPGDVITLQASGLPAFASFTDNGNGTGVVHLAPGNTPGQFNDITITATDNNNASTFEQFNVTVTNPNINSVYINFNQTLPAAAPWNNMNSSPTANTGISNLLDDAGIPTGANITLQDAWTNQTTTGYTTGNNSGLYPDNVMVTSYYYTGNSTRRILLSGLSASKRYSIKFFASRNNYGSPLTTRYAVGAQSVDLNAQNNLSNTVEINDLIPDASGNILITAQAVVGPNAYIGSMVIQSYTPDLDNPVAPLELTAAGISKTSIRLNWASTANNGYEVWRSSTATGTYTKRADIAANTTTYTDNGLTAATVYFYKVKTVLNGNTSGFSNYAGASTVAYTINLNMNDGTAGAPAQGGNWNNTNALIADGFTLPNMINDQGQNTGINFNVVTTFSGFNYYGTSTGNNSGIYPDNTMTSFYYCNFADTARLKITGLTLAHAYNFVFFGSRVNPVVGVTTAYKIGNNVVTLDASNNTQNVVKIAGIVPEPDGSVSITIYGINTGGYGYLNVLSIEGAPYVASETMARNSNPQQQSKAVLLEESRTKKNEPVTAKGQQISPAGDQDPLSNQVQIYPNPFRDDLTLKFDIQQNVSRFTVIVSDASGRVVYRKEITNASKGINTYKLDLRDASIGSGIYFVRILGLPGNGTKGFKLIKQ